jgi:hypothetical protein
MFKFAKITLLALAAFLVLGFSITVNAGKPTQNQTMMSAPLHGNLLFTCVATNLTDRAMSAEFHYINESGVDYGSGCPEDCDPADKISIAAGETGKTSWLAVASTGEIAHCVINWVGDPNDLRASFCHSPFLTYESNICFELF